MGAAFGGTAGVSGDSVEDAQVLWVVTNFAGSSYELKLHPFWPSGIVKRGNVWGTVTLGQTRDLLLVETMGFPYQNWPTGFGLRLSQSRQP